MPSTNNQGLLTVSCQLQMIRLCIMLMVGCSVWSVPVVPPTCEFHSGVRQTFNVGESWEIRVGTQKDFLCMNCTCLPASRSVQCLPMTGKTCPDIDDCLTVVNVPNSCCPVCTEVRNNVRDTKPIPEAPEDHERPAESRDCVHNGLVYQSGERWSPEPNTTGVRPQRVDQCVQCECQSTHTICYAKICPKYACKGMIISSPDNCCPVCEEFVPSTKSRQLETAEIAPYEHSNGVSEDEFDPYTEMADEEHQQGCISGPEKYESGSQWNPIIAPFGRIKCVLCECLNGNIRCKRQECPDKLPCSRPVTKPGQCCPVCDETNEIANVTGGGTFLCVRYGDYLVYENLHGGTIDILLRLPEEDTVWRHTWKMGITNTDVSTTQMKLWEFRRLHSADHYRLLGVSRPKKVNRFARRINKIRRTCQQRCNRRTERLIQVLQIQAVQSSRKSECSEKSRPVNTLL